MFLCFSGRTLTSELLSSSSAGSSCITAAVSFHEPNGVLQTGKVICIECCCSNVKDSSQTFRNQRGGNVFKTSREITSITLWLLMEISTKLKSVYTILVQVSLLSKLLSSWSKLLGITPSMKKLVQINKGNPAALYYVTIRDAPIRF